MNGLINCNILFSAPSDFESKLSSFGISFVDRFSRATKGYVSRRAGTHFLFGWSPRYMCWYYLFPRWDTTNYCWRCYFSLYDDAHQRYLGIDDLDFVIHFLGADDFISE